MTNEQRRERAYHILVGYAHATGLKDSDIETAAQDLFSDITHLLQSDAYQIDAEDLFFHAYDRYSEEVCSECGADIDDGEGWDGLCGNCADKAEDDED